MLLLFSSLLFEGNGGYTKHTNKDYLKLAADDVRHLYRCLSKEMFDCLSRMIKEAWIAAGHKRLADVFFDSYIEKDNYNLWHCTASGLSSCTSMNQPNERSTLEFKGTSSFSGFCSIGKNIGTMLRYEFPKAIYRLSVERAGVNRRIRLDHRDVVLNKKSILYKELITYCHQIEPSIDIYRPEGESYCYMNREMFLGHNLTKTRILLYEDAVIGKTCVSWDKRTEFIDHVHSMCKVTHTIGLNGVKTYSGSCNEYWERSYCHHSAFLKYREELIILSEPVETHRAKHKWKKPLGSRVSERQELVIVVYSNIPPRRSRGSDRLTDPIHETILMSVRTSDRSRST